MILQGKYFTMNEICTSQVPDPFLDDPQIWKELKVTLTNNDI